MSCLILDLRAGQMLLVNGAQIRFRTRARLELLTHARFVFGSQFMSPEEADTPARRFYLALQTAYVGATDERAFGLEAARALAPVLNAATNSGIVRDAVDRAIAAAEADDGFRALKLSRLLVQHESAVLGRRASTRQCGSGAGRAGDAAAPELGDGPRTTSGGA